MISVIIPTRNRAALLSLALRSLEVQILPRERFEVVVVDNGSTDGTADVITAHAIDLPNLRAVFEPEPGLHAGRHRGLREARGDVLVFIDDDVEATPTWLTAIAECFADTQVVMVGGNNLPKFERTPPDWLARLWARPVYDGKAIPWLSILRMPDGIRQIDPCYVWGCNFAIRRTALVAAHGFHPDAMPREMIRFRGDGETHVSRYVAASGLTCLFHSGATVFHFVDASRMTIAYFRQRAFDQGISDSFSDLRQGHGRVLLGLKSIFVYATRRLRAALEIDRELRQLRGRMAAGYREGYLFHQRAYRLDPHVREWVSRPDFMGDEVLEGDRP
ncbi:MULTISPECIES: glycosyltransferase family 2 protein [unclassified Thiocapsa]|uniref:glycosyltransferase family 2 protein n=1 Tax=unclassified Thiocapsa TaxID=2641286 RepID=UPI0035AFB889